MRVQLNKAHFPVTTLGPGRRIGLWFQGCHVRCPGCCSRDTWSPDPDREIEVDELLAWCRSVAADGCDGVTITGGEPFEQPAALAELLDHLHQWRAELKEPFDLLCYSGLSLRRLERYHADVLRRLDALIPEPFVAGFEQTRTWRGSANQPLVLLSKLGRDRYAAWVDAGPGPEKRFQVAVDGAAVWFIGIPDRDALQQLEAAVRKRGVVLGGVSWRA